ncbi:hypothetical protein ACFOLJ_24755 [Rugamonas sp. CCM 8940]|uniref:hypothetical protein n=1 Tax=Rugamonas sp. CCM 8940 TaxID=2765359 RepID=UPI0018F4FD18|nr:hypothetical protein [Rugamonas sp. CCM 8940]MBJ7313191.1 hypothetical protein [Rugamonas sp. CCM 8940]
MIKTSTLRWVVTIFAISVLLQVVLLVSDGFSAKLLLRFILLCALFAMLMKGVRIARYLLAILMGLSVLPAVVYAVKVQDNPVSVWFYALYAVYALASALFFFRSPVLRQHTAKR